MLEQILMPPFPDGVEAGTVVNWIKKAGEHVEAGEVICEIESDKANLEVVAHSAGTIVEILEPPGKVIQSGTALCTLSCDLVTGVSGTLTASETQSTNDKSTCDYDLVVIGAGPGGYVAAIRARQLGLSCAIIEKDRAGGVCGNWGCIPSKSLLHTAETIRQSTGLAALGVSVDVSHLDYALVHRKSRDASLRAERGVMGLLKKNGVVFIKGTAQLSGTHTVSVSNPSSANQEDQQKITARNILLATGSSPRTIPGFVFDEDRILSSNGILAMTSLPASLLVIGAGAIGLEFAFIMNAFGVQVTVAELMDRILPQEDSAISSFMLAELSRSGIKFMCQTQASNPVRTKEGITVTLSTTDGKQQEITVERVLVATGRLPNIRGLGIEEAGIKTEKGCISVGDWYQTSVAGIFAIGDLVASPFLAHVASREGELAVEYMAGHGKIKKLDPLLIPSAIYTEPSVGSFGLTEEQAKARGVSAGTYTFSYKGLGKANAMEKTNGFIKIVYDSHSHDILGAHLAGYNACELVHEILLARQYGIKPSQIAAMVHAHPGISEGILEAMRGVEGYAIHA